MPVQALSLSVSSPSKERSTISNVENVLLQGLLAPIELANNCSETGVKIDSDDILLTNAIRQHYLQHFGHRDMTGIMSLYAPNAIVIQCKMMDGEEVRVKHHGHDEISNHFQEIFDLHAPVDSSFLLETIKIEQKHATAVWSAKTPTLVIEEGLDTFVFNGDGMIIKQFFT
ncbi:MAG: hypothetical protein SGARI_004690, partial [Bacillariaceae sp.]